jgi:molybdenum-dependent DNA-binding transcriptional regulator ModE
MKRELRGRPPLNIPLEEIIRAVRETGYVMRAARKLGCSDAYIRQRLKAAGLSLAKVLLADNNEEDE